MTKVGVVTCGKWRDLGVSHPLLFAQNRRAVCQQ